MKLVEAGKLGTAMLLTDNKTEHIKRIVKKIWLDVLQLSELTLKDHFLALGGNSLAAVRIVHRINEIFTIELPLTAIFEADTIQSLTILINKQPKITNPEKAVWKNAGFELSPAQRQMYFMDHYVQHAAVAYNEIATYELKGNLEVEALEKSINFLVKRHDMLRVSFMQDADEIMQKLHDDLEIKLNVEYIPENALQERLRLEAQIEIDLKNFPLIHFRLFQISPSHYFFMIIQPHIITDAWSTAIFMQELQQCYKLAHQHQPLQLDNIALGYGDFVLRQNAYLNSREQIGDLHYWRSKLDGYSETTFPIDHKRLEIKSFAGKKYKFMIGPPILKKILEFNSARHTTTFMLMSAVISLLLSRYNQQDDTVIGFPISGRSAAAGFKNTLGLFLNTLVLRNQLSEDETFEDFLFQTKQNCLEAFQHQNLPFERLVSQLKIPRSQNTNPIFQVIIVWQDMLTFDPLVFPGFIAQPHYIDNQTAKFDIAFEFISSEQGLACFLEYDTTLYEPSTIERMALHFNQALTTILDNPKQRLCDIAFITAGEEKQLLDCYEHCVTKHTDITPMHRLFEAQAKNHPDNIALHYAESCLTYKELNEKSNQLAHYIYKNHLQMISTGVTTTPCIGVCLERGMDLLIAILAILKAGAAYVPLDPEWPRTRLDFVLNDAECSLIITENLHADKVVNPLTNRLLLDGLSDEIKKMPTENPKNITNDNDVMYVIYTSGTTGTPKGVQQTHLNVNRLFKAAEKLYHFTQNDVWVLFHSYTFDFSIWEMWGAFLYGGCLIIPSYQETRDPVLFYQLVLKHKVTVLNQTPSAFKVFVQEEQSHTARLQDLNYIIFGGEVFDIRLATLWWKRYPENKPFLINMYGITETTVHTTYKMLSTSDLFQREFSNIGVLLNDMCGYVVDKQLKLVPVGVPGELLISGFGLSPGYIHRPDLNDEKFIPNPFKPETVSEHSPFARAYRTGDLVRWLSNGSLEYLGRIDNQLKIKGFRMEAGEIEMILREHPAVRDCLAMHSKQEDSTLLIAYYTCKDGVGPGVDEPVLNSELRTYLLNNLPAYMVPHLFVKLDKIPLTHNMKIDYKALPPPPKQTSVKIQPEKSMQLSEAERLLMEVWMKKLRIDAFTIDDNFFNLGGDSIISIVVVAEARKKGFAFTVSDMFRAQTIRQLAQFYKKEKKTKPHAKKTSLHRVPKAILAAYGDAVDIYPLSTLQAGMVYHSRFSEKAAVYLDVFCYFFSGRYDKDILIQSINHLVNRHPILRTSFLFDGFDEAMQCIHKGSNWVFSEIDNSHLSQAEQKAVITQWFEKEKSIPFDYETAPLFRVTIHVFNPNQFAFGIAFHHSIMDGWSLASFISQLFDMYSLIKNNEWIEKKPDWNFKKFIQLEKKALVSKKSRAFWKKELTDFTTIERHEVVHREPMSKEKQFYSEQIVIDSSITKKLILLAKDMNISLDEIILAAHMKCLSVYSGQDDVISGVVFNGRPAVDGIEQTLGLFLNTLPFRINLTECSWRELISIISEKKKALYPYRRYPLMQILKDTKTENLFDVIFYYTHFHVYNSFAANDDFKLEDQTFYERTNFPLAVNFTLNPLQKTLGLRINYESPKYSYEQILHLMEIYRDLLSDIAHQPNHKHSQFSLLTETEKALILHQWNSTDVAYPENTLLLNAIEEATKNFPQKTALIFEDRAVSYEELDTKSNQLANYIKTLNSSKGIFIGVYLDRSESAIIAILAVLKSGNIYVPLDPFYPPERIQYILNDANMAVLISTKKHVETNQLAEAMKIIYLEEFAEIFHSVPASKPKLSIKSHDLAYTIYTSGTTGKPKGVMIEHGSWFNILYDMQKRIEITPQDTLFALTSFSFDISLLEIFLPLMTGSCCVIASYAGSKDPGAVKQAVQKYSVTVVQATPATWQMLFEHQFSGLSASIKIVCGGERLSPQLAEQLCAFSPWVWNVYGPTETTIWSTAYRLSSKDKGTTHSIIGRPIANTKVYVLNHRLQPVPIGAIGNLYISGIGLARGYLNRDDLTAEKFIANPFELPNSLYNRLYHTGDLVRWLPDGEIEYIGRNDHQLKIRGFRVEAAEIETVLLEHPKIKSSIVLVKNHKGEAYLTAYIVKRPTTTDSLSAREVRQFLAKKLPYYYVPDKYVFLDKMPMTPNAKIDRQALMNIETKSDNEEAEPTTAQLSPDALKLARIWREVLSMEAIHPNDNFYDLGGNSISTLRIINKINQVFSIRLEITELIENPIFEVLFERIVLLKDRVNNLGAKENMINFTKTIPDPVIKLKKTGNKSPLFLIHPVGGNIFYYIPFVKLLTDDRPVLAIQDPGVLTREMLFSTLKEMANFYVQVIKTYQPKGPYLLAGSSFGANTTIEVARQLHQQGEELVFVGLIDGWAQYPKEANENKEWFRDNQLQQLKVMNAYFSEEDVPEIFLDLHWHRQQLLVNHAIEKIPEKINLTLFKASETMDVLLPLESDYNNWDKYASTIPKVFIVTGDHFTLHFPPNHESLAEQMDCCLMKIGT